MHPIHSTTGHSLKKEKKMARTLYWVIAIVTFIAFALIFVVGLSPEMNPFKSGNPAADSPDTVPGTVPKPGAIAEPVRNPSDIDLNPSTPIKPPKK